MPIFYECQRCAACCRWPGPVRVSEAEIERLAAHLGLSDKEFRERHTQLLPDRRGLSLIEREDGACIFLRDAACVVQPVKPQQCRDFPNLWRFPGFERQCHAIARELPLAEYVRTVAAATGRPPAEVRERVGLETTA